MPKILFLQHGYYLFKIFLKDKKYPAIYNSASFRCIEREKGRNAMGISVLEKLIRQEKIITLTRLILYFWGKTNQNFSMVRDLGWTKTFFIILIEHNIYIQKLSNKYMPFGKRKYFSPGDGG